MIEPYNPDNENRPLAPLLGSLTPAPEQPEVLTHSIAELRSASTLRIPELGLLAAIGQKNDLHVALEGTTVLRWQTPNASILDTHLFTVPKISGVEVWVGGFIRGTGENSESHHYFKQLGKAHDISADNAEPSTFRALEPFTRLRTNEGRFPKASTRVSDGSTKTLYFLADYASTKGNSSTDIWHCHAGSDQFIQNLSFAGSVRSMAMTSDPRRIAIGYQNGNIAIRKVSSGGRIADQNLFRVRLIDLGLSGGSFATALQFAAANPKAPTKRDLLLVGTNRGEVARLGIDNPAQTQIVAAEGLGRVRSIDSDNKGRIKVYTDKS